MKVYSVRCAEADALNERRDKLSEATQTLLIFRLQMPAQVFTLWEETETGSRLVTPCEIAEAAERLKYEACRLIAAIEINRVTTNAGRADSIRRQLKTRNAANMAGADVVGDRPTMDGPTQLRTPSIGGVPQCCRFHREGGNPMRVCDNSGQE